MLELDLTTAFLSALTPAGPLALALALFLGPLGLPVPTGLLAMAAGASVRQGLMPWSAAVGLALAATLLGDSASYTLGRLSSSWVHRLMQQRAAAWQRAQERFQHHGGLTIYLTRVLLTALDVPTNLLAGSSRYPFWRFLTWNLAGRATWLVLYGGLGYTSAASGKPSAICSVPTACGWALQQPSSPPSTTCYAACARIDNRDPCAPLRNLSLEPN